MLVYWNKTRKTLKGARRSAPVDDDDDDDGEEGEDHLLLIL